MAAQERKPNTLLLGTRVHLSAHQADSGHHDITNVTNALRNFLSHHCTLFASDGSIMFGVAVGVAEECDERLFTDFVGRVRDICRQVATCNSQTIQVIVVSPWGKFVPALNSLVTVALRCKCATILFASLELRVSEASVGLLCSHIGHDNNVLVAGVRLFGHNSQKVSSPVQMTSKDTSAVEASSKSSQQCADSVDKGNNGCISVPLGGDTCPWNTCALWNVELLSRTGFLLVSEGIAPGVEAGVEEVCCIALQQKLFPHDSIAKLVSCPNVMWDTNKSFNMKTKIASKIQRAASQLQVLGLEGSGSVQHIGMTEVHADGSID